MWFVYHFPLRCSLPHAHEECNAWCLSSHKLWGSPPLPSPGLWVCRPHQNNISLCPDWFHQSTALYWDRQKFSKAEYIFNWKQSQQKHLFLLLLWVRPISASPQCYHHLPMSFFSWMNLTLERTSAESSIAWLKPFSPPYEISTSFRTLACNLC